MHLQFIMWMFVPVVVAGCIIGQTNAQDCLSFSQWISMGDAVTSITCVTGEPNAQPTMPAGISVLTNLINLKITNDNLVGTIPPTIALLTKLTSLRIEDNLIDGTMPDISALIALTTLKWRGNKSLTPGPIPDVFANMPNLRSVDYSDTGRTGTLPASMLTRPKLGSFYVSQNTLKGTIPNTIYDAVDLKKLIVYDNAFTGTVPLSIARSKLDSIEIDNNQFEGSLENHNFVAYTFRDMYVKNNRMYGNMPQFGTQEKIEADIVAGESLGDFIPNGESCAGKTEKCSSGALSCGSTNNICCAAIYTSPNVRGVCQSGICATGALAGACVVQVSSTSPSVSPVAQTGSPVDSNEIPTTTIAPNSNEITLTPTTPDIGSVQRPTASFESEPVKDETVLQVGLAVGSIMGMFLLFYVAQKRNKKNQQKHGYPGKPKHSPSSMLFVGNNDSIPVRMALPDSFSIGDGDTLYTGDNSLL